MRFAVRLTLIVGVLLLTLELLGGPAAADGGPAPDPPAWPAFLRQAVETNVPRQGSTLDDDSGIDTQAPTTIQIENLILLAKVWGFVKYHHPRVANGVIDWDQDLLRVMPEILRAVDAFASRTFLSEWLERLGQPEPCDPCATMPDDVQTEPDLGWIHDRADLGEDLSSRLELIYRRRPPGSGRHHVSLYPGIGNPDFHQEDSYPGMVYPDAGYRLLALFRLWSIVQYWCPYREVMDRDWDTVLPEFIPRFMSAGDPTEYHLAVLELMVRMDDTHSSFWAGFDLRPPRGDAQVPIVLRFVEEKAVVTGFSHPELGPASGLRIGDVIGSIDGRSVDSLVAAVQPYYAASNEPARLRDIGWALTRGEAGPVFVCGVRQGAPFGLRSHRVPRAELDQGAGRTHDRPGEAFERLSDEVAYLKLSSFAASDAASYIQRADGAEVLVIDLRGYPSEFAVFDLGAHLVAAPTEFARFTLADLSNPGAFVWSEPVLIQPQEPHFEGRVVLLVDETTQSQTEYTAMAFRSVPGALVVGSTTAGADGDISYVSLPGGITVTIGGLGVFYPDRRPTQRIGIVPDIVVLPTLEGVLAGRDEVFEAALCHTLGRGPNTAR